MQHCDKLSPILGMEDLDLIIEKLKMGDGEKRPVHVLPVVVDDIRAGISSSRSWCRVSAWMRLTESRETNLILGSTQSY